MLPSYIRAQSRRSLRSRFRSMARSSGSSSTAYHAYSLWVVVVFFVPALALQRFIHLYQEEKEARATRSLQRASSRPTSRFATGARRDARCSRSLHGRPLCGRRDLRPRHRAADGLSEDEQDLVHLCGLVHDIGKIGLPAWSARKARAAHARGASADGEALQRSASRSSGIVDDYVGDCRDRPASSRAGRRHRAIRTACRRRHPTPFQDHLGG